MKKIIAVSFVLVLAMAILPATSLAEELRLGVNGETWNSIEKNDGGDETKQAYVLGIYTGYSSGRAKYDTREERDGDLYWDTSYEILVEALDKFFSDPRNGNIPVFHALRIIAQELRGIDRMELDEIMESEREIYDGIPPDNE